MAQVNLGRVVGYSAYEIAVQNGFVGTEAEWLASLQGEDGATGPQGPQGPAGPAGTTSWSGINDKPFSTIGTGLEVVNGALNATGGSGGMDEDDVKDLISSEYGMKKSVVMSGEPGTGSLYTFSNQALNTAMEISLSDCGIYASTQAELRAVLPEIRLQVYSMPNFADGTELTLAPGEGGMGGQLWEAWYLPNGTWVAGGDPGVNVFDTLYCFGINMEWDVDETPSGIQFSNPHMSEIVYRDIQNSELISGTISASADKVQFSKLLDGFINADTWATKSDIYSYFPQDKAAEFIANQYGMGSHNETQTWSIDEPVEITSTSQTRYVIRTDDLQPAIDASAVLHLYFQFSNAEDAMVEMYWDSENEEWKADLDNYATWDDSASELSVTITPSALVSTYGWSEDPESFYPSISWNEEVFTPLADEYTPEGVLTDIGDIFDRLDGITSVPTTSGANEGDILAVNRGGEPVWITPTSEVPSYDSTTIGKVLGVQQQDTRSPAPLVELAWVDKPEGVPTYSGASEGDVLSINDRGDMEWTAVSAPSEIEYESTHSSGEDYVVTWVSGDDNVKVTEMVYDNGNYNPANYTFMSGGELGASDDSGDNSVIIGTDMITFNGLDSNDDPVNGELSMSADGELQWNGSSIIPTYTSSDAGNVLSVNSLGDGVEWAPASGGSTVEWISFPYSGTPSAAATAYLEALYQNVGYLASNPAIFWNSTYNIPMQLCEVDRDNNRLSFYGEYNRVNPNTYEPETTPYVTRISFNGQGHVTGCSNGSVNAVKAGVGITMSYNSVSVDTTQVALKSELLPACPTTTDGTFVLKATVSSGAVTYSWVAEN